MATLIKVLALLLLGPAYDLVSDCLKKQVVESAIKLFQYLRVLFFIRFLMSLSAVVIMSGFILMPIALYSYLPWTVEEKALLLLIMSAAYVILPPIFLLCIFTSNNWLKMLGLTQLAASLKNKGQ